MTEPPLAQPSRSIDDPLRQVTSGVVRWQGGAHAETTDELVAEEPLEIRALPIDVTQAPETIAVIMRTPGHDDELAAGFLLSEGLVTRGDELLGFTPGLDADGLPSPNLLDVRAAAGVDIARRMREAGYSRQFAVNSSCGVCGKNTVEAACALLPPIPLAGFHL
ncbi:MAG TPA: formate dehydrogenase accessory sulfurtransferase FdhD, partial [Ktedonobacterales bacterium]